VPGRSLTLALLLAVLAVGCGGDDDGGDETGAKQPVASDTPAANEPLKAAATRLEEALPGGDCKTLVKLMLHSLQRGTTDPAAPPRKRDCRYVEGEARSQLKGYRVTKVREFGGTAGFSEGTGASARGVDVVGIVWLLDSDGSWKAAFEATYRPQIGPPPYLAREADANAAKLVGAMIRADCATMWRGFSYSSRFVAGTTRAKFCRGLPAVYRDPRSAFGQIKGDPTLRAELLGRTRDFSFYALRLRNGRYMDLVMSGPLAGTPKAQLRQHANPSALELATVRQP
jgi:hypothetical protein